MKGGKWVCDRIVWSGTTGSQGNVSPCPPLITSNTPLGRDLHSLLALGQVLGCGWLAQAGKMGCLLRQGAFDVIIYAASIEGFLLSLGSVTLAKEHTRPRSSEDVTCATGIYNIAL